MRGSTIVLEGKVKEFARSEAGNLAFMLEESGGNIHYCFSPVKKALLGISDDIVVYGSYHGTNKVRVDYILNKTRNSEDILIETRQSWAYTLSLIISICTTGLVVLSFLVLLRIIPIGFFGTLDSIFSFVFSLIMVITLLPVIIIMWVLTSAFGKKRRENEEITNQIKDIKDKLGISESPKPSVAQKQELIQSESKDIGTAKFCAHCGERLPHEAKFCSKCGAKWD